MRHVGRIQIALVYALAAFLLASCKFPFSKTEDETNPGSTSSLSTTPYLTISALDSSVVPKGCHAFRVVYRDVAGNPTGMEERTSVYISTSSNVQAYRDSACSQNLNYLTFSAGTSSKIFYAKANAEAIISLIADAGDVQVSTGSTLIDMDPFGPPDASTSTITGTNSVKADGSSSSTVTITLKDQYGNNVVGETPTFNATGTANTVGTCTASNSSGVSTCTLKSTKAEVKTLTLSAPVSTPGDTITFVPGDAAAIRVLSQPGDAVAGSAFGTQPIFEIIDANDNVVTSSSATVTAAIHSGSGSLLGTTSVNALNGVATFTNLQIDSPDTFILRASSSGLSSTDTASFNVSGGAASRLAFGTEPGGATAGSNFAAQPVVRIEDSVGNLVTSSSASVAIEILSGSGTLAGTTTVTAVNGVATFSDLRIDQAATFTLRVTSSGLTQATSTAFTVSPGAASKLAFATSPSGFTAGVAFTTQPVIQVRDAFNNHVTNSTASVTFQKYSGPTGGYVLGTTTVTASGGVATFSGLHIDVSGSYDLKATSTGLSSAQATGVTVLPNDPAKLVFTVNPGGAIAGAAMTTQPKVEIHDAYNNLTSSSASVTLALTSGTGSLIGTTTVNASSGVAAFSGIQLNVAQEDALITASSGSLTSAESNPIDVTASDAAKVVFDLQPGGAVSGAVFSTQPKVSVRDAYDNLITGSSAQIDLTIETGGGTLLGTTSLNATNGVASFTDLKINAANTNYSLRAVSSGLTSIVSNSFDVTAGAAAKLVFTTQPSSAIRSVAFGVQPVVEIQDAQDNRVDSNATVTLSVAEGTGNLGGSLSVSAVNGVATFSGVSLDAAGDFKILASALGFNVTSSTLSVSEGVAHHLSFVSQPSSDTAAGAAIITVVQIRDADNNVVSSSDPVTIGITGGGELGGTLTVNAINGSANFSDLHIDTSGTYSFTASIPKPLSADSDTFTISPAAAAKLILAQQPSASGTAGEAFSTQPIVHVKDTYGNLVTGSSASVTAAVESGTGTLLGVTTVTASGGVATFSGLTFNVAGVKKLKFTSSSLNDASTGNFTINPAAPSYLHYATQPANATSGSAFGVQPVVEVRDFYDNVVTSSTAEVTATISAGPSSVLAGTATITASSGIASFSNLRIDQAGANYQLQVTAPSITSALSGLFNVVAGAPKKFVFNTQPDGGVAGTPFSSQPRLEIWDAQNNKVDSSLSVTAAIHTGSGELLGTLSNVAVNGTVQFTDLRINKAEAGYKLKFSATGMDEGVSDAFTVTPNTTTQLRFVTQPGGAVVNQVMSQQPVVELLDAYENRVLTDGAAITLTVNTGLGSLSGGSTTVSTTSGVATFSGLKLDTVYEGVSLKASDGIYQVISDPFNVTPGAAAKLAFSQQPSGAKAGLAFSQQPKVELRDADDNLVPTTGVTITIAKKTGTGTLQGTLSATTTSGVATFTDLRIDQAGDFTLEPASTGINTVAESSTFTVSPNDATKLVFSVAPSGAVAGAAFATQPQVQVQDQYDNVVNSSSSIHIEIFEGSGTLQGTPDVNASAGTAVFSGLRIDQAGSFKLKVTSAGLTSAETGTFTVVAGAFHHAAFTSGNSFAAGSCHTVTIQARDEFENPVTMAAAFNLDISTTEGILGFSTGASCGAAGAGSLKPTVTISVGEHSASAKFIDNLAGNVNFVALEGATFRGTQTATITAGARHHLTLSAASTTPTVANCVAIAATVEDQYNNVVPAGTLLAVVITGFESGKLYTENTCASELSGSWPFAAANTTQTIYFKNNKTESNTLTFTDAANLSQSSSVGPIAWTSTASKLVITGDSPIPSNECHDYVAQREDNLGNAIPVSVLTPLTFTASVGYIFAGAGCTGSPSSSFSANLGTGESSYTFSFKSSISSVTSTLTASESASITNGVLSVVVSGGGAGVLTSIEFVSPQTSIAIAPGSIPCTKYTIRLLDGVGNAYAPTSDLPVTLTSSSVYANLSDDNNCAVDTSGSKGIGDGGRGRKVPAGHSTYEFYMRHPIAGSITLTVAGGGKSVTSPSIVVTDSRSATDIVAFKVNAVPTFKAQECTLLTVNLMEKSGTSPRPAAGGEAFYPVFYSAEDGSLLDVVGYSDPGCTAIMNSGTARTFNAGQSDYNLYFRYPTPVAFEFYALHATNQLAAAYFAGSFRGGFLDKSFSTDGLVPADTSSTHQSFYLLRSDPTAARTAAGQNFYPVFAGTGSAFTSFSAEVYQGSGTLLRSIDTNLGVSGAEFAVTALGQTYDASESKLIIAGTANEGRYKIWAYGFVNYSSGVVENSVKGYPFENEVEVLGIAAKKDSEGDDLITMVGRVGPQQTILRVDEDGDPVSEFGSGGLVQLAEGKVTAITYDPVSSKTFIARYGSNYSIDLLSDSGTLTVASSNLPSLSVCTYGAVPLSMKVQHTTDSKNYLWTAFDCTGPGGISYGVILVAIDIDAGTTVQFSGSPYKHLNLAQLAPTATNLELDSIEEKGDQMVLAYTVSNSISRKGVGVARVNLDGTLDTNYNTAGVFVDYFDSLFLSSNATTLGFGLDGSNRVFFGARLVGSPATETYNLMGRLTE